jgi:hypothetical protein
MLIGFHKRRNEINIYRNLMFLFLFFEKKIVIQRRISTHGTNFFCYNYKQTFQKGQISNCTKWQDLTLKLILIINREVFFLFIYFWYDWMILCLGSNAWNQGVIFERLCFKLQFFFKNTIVQWIWICSGNYMQTYIHPKKRGLGWYTRVDTC